MNKTLLPIIVGIFIVGSFGLSQNVFAISVTDIEVTNLSWADRAFTNPSETRFVEFRAANIGTSSITGDINEQSFSNHFAWMNAQKVIQPEGPNFALIHLPRVGYEITFTVEDPLNQGYEINVEHLIRGALTVERQEGIERTISTSTGPWIGKLKDGICDPTTHLQPNTCNKLNLFVNGVGGVSVKGDEEPRLENKLGESDKSFTSTPYVGTNTFTVEFNSSPSPAIWSIISNYGGGETNARFGLAPTIPQIENGDYPGPDGEDASNLGHFVDISVTAIEEASENTAPVAVDDIVEVDEDNSIDVAVLDNDSDPDGDEITIVGTTDPSNGSITINDGIVTYTPNENFNGDDSFTYTITDGEFQDTATVSITVIPVNDAPVCDVPTSSLDSMWPPNNKMKSVTVGIGATDVDGDELTFTISGIFQDEEVNGLGDGDTSPDAEITGDKTVNLRAERSGLGDGRVYIVTVSASDGELSCSGDVTIGVPHDKKSTAVDSGNRFDSTKP